MRRAKASEVVELAEPVPIDEWAPPAKLGPEDVFAIQLRQFPSLEFVQQLRFAHGKLRGKNGRGWRQWKFDFAFPKFKLAVEIDGVCVQRLGGRLVVMGRHASIEGIRGDNEKLNCAALLGWTVIRFLQSDVKPRHAIDVTLRVLAARGWRA